MSEETFPSKYTPSKTESKIYKQWESSGAFTPKIDPKKKPFTIILPLPNANDPMHMGHALFTIQDIMIRYHRMLGEPTLWLPGGDHAGIETQFIFEKKLKKQGKSRFDFDRETLYKMIAEFVEENKTVNKDQMKRLGFSMDWTRYHYSLEPEIVEKVLKTFRKMHNDGLIYRGERIVNFCTSCGTAFSDLEIKYIERKDPLFYIKYGPFVLATARLETKFGDTAVAFHPGDKRYEKYLGQEIEITGVNGSFKVKVIADDAIDPDFGTGIEKVTPAHDILDFEIGQRHNLPIKKVIEVNGRLNDLAGKFSGMKVMAARKAVYEEMKKMGLIDHVDENYVHNVAVCYRCGTTIEPMVMPQWFLKMEPLAKPAIEAVKKGKTKIVPRKRFEKMYFDWLENIRDWNISRQVVWGPRLPIWYCLDCNKDLVITFHLRGVPPSRRTTSEVVSGTWQELKAKYPFDEIKKGLQSLAAGKNPIYSLEEKPCQKCAGKNILQETDTFDTWFLSGQWPLTTLGINIDDLKKSSEDFKYFYPTSVLDTLWDILFFWVARMMMLGLYLTKEIPFKTIHLHARVVDKFGKKMSKSKGNVVDPIEMADKYGADALRMALVIGVAPASDIAISDDKVRAMRNFANKLWNVARFINLVILNRRMAVKNPTRKSNEILRLLLDKLGVAQDDIKPQTPADKDILKKLNSIVKSTTKDIENYRFGEAAHNLYHFIWHEFADRYIETAKEQLKNPKLTETTLVTCHLSLVTCLKLLHPFMPFATEEIWGKLQDGNEDTLMTSKWPDAKNKSQNY